MILDELMLRGFGVYKNEQVLHLTPRSSKKPVVLLGGMNGGGKTTILDALQLVLFGKNAQCSNRGTLGYSEYLRKCINSNVPKDEGAAIALQFRYHSQGEQEALRVERSWWVTSSGAVRERLEVTRNPFPDPKTHEFPEPDPILTEAWPEHVQKFMPPSISHLFFFDGEKIETFADVDNSAEILSTAIGSLLGLDLVDQLTTDLGVLERRKRSEKREDVSVQQEQVAREELKVFRGHLQDAVQEKAKAQNELDSAQKELRKAEKTYKKQGGDAFENRANLEARQEAVKREIEELENRQRSIAAAAGPLLLVPSMLKRIADQDSLEQQVAQSATLSQVLKTRDKRLLTQAAKVGADAQVLDGLKKFLSRDRRTRAKKSEAPCYLGLSQEGRTLLSTLQGKRLQMYKRDMDDLVNQATEKRAQLEYFNEKLNAVPSQDAIEAVIQTRDEARDAVESAKARLRGLHSDINRLSGVIERKERGLQRLITKSNQHHLVDEDNHRLVRHSIKVREKLNTFRTKLVERHVQRIEKLILDSFHQLVRKHALVSELSIDPETFRVELFDRDGMVLSPGRLSAGERQLLAVSMLWGLARASERQLPAVIDTPLGRLDSSHRGQLVKRYFPKASHQVILLSTDEEIDARYYKQLAPHIARSYLLKFDDKAGETIVREGYFWEQ